MRLMAMAGSAQAAAGRDGGASSRYGAGRRSPLGLGGTVAVHALVVGAFLLIPKQVIEHFSPAPPIDTYAVPLDPPPPPVEQVEPAPEAAGRPGQPIDRTVPPTQSSGAAGRTADRTARLRPEQRETPVYFSSRTGT